VAQAQLGDLAQLGRQALETAGPLEPADGGELGASGAYKRVTEHTALLADAAVELPDLPCPIARHPFRERAGAKLAALAAVAAWLESTSALQLDALWAVLDTRYPEEAEATRAALSRVSMRLEGKP